MFSVVSVCPQGDLLYRAIIHHKKLVLLVAPKLFFLNVGEHYDKESLHI